MNADRKSDESVVPTTPVNKGAAEAAESVEGRGPPKGNAVMRLLAPDTVPRFARHRARGYGW